MKCQNFSPPVYPLFPNEKCLAQRQQHHFLGNGRTDLRYGHLSIICGMMEASSPTQRDEAKPGIITTSPTDGGNESQLFICAHTQTFSVKTHLENSGKRILFFLILIALADMISFSFIFLYQAGKFFLKRCI